MKQPLRTVFSLLFLVVFLAGTTGISFFKHECTSSGTTEVYPFPEILNNAVSCCCVNDIQKNPCEGPVSSFNAPECCKNTHIFLKASITGFPLFYQFNPEVLQIIIPVDFLSMQNNEKVAEIVSFTPRIDHPPPRSGKLLVCFLQQIKIPAPVS